MTRSPGAAMHQSAAMPQRLEKDVISPGSPAPVSTPSAPTSVASPIATTAME